MKITFNNTIFSIEKTGGISRYFICLIKELIKNKLDVKVISALHKNKFLTLLPKETTTGLYLPNYPLFKLIENYNNKDFNNYINSKSTDIIHDTYYTPNINKPKKIKKVITVHDLIHEKFKDYYRNSKNEISKKKEAFIDCDHFICVSNNTKNDLVEFYNIEPDKISVIYHGANHLTNIKDNYDSKINDPYLLYVGKRDRYKNFMFLLKAYAKCKRVNENFKLVCFGGNKFNKIEKQLINELNIQRNIKHVKGDDKILSTYYSSAKALIAPSLYEGFGLNVIEAMSFKCPVICSNIDVFKEICTNDAIYFDPKDENNLIHVMEEYLFKDTYMKNLAFNSYKRSKNFTWEKNCNETINVYKKLI